MVETVPAIEQETDSTLPTGWTQATLDVCADILDSKREPVNSDERERRIAGKSEAELYPYYGATGQVGWIDGYLFDERLVLLGEDGAPFLDPTRHKAYIIKGKSWVNNHAHVLRAKTGLLSNDYLCHYLNVFDYHGYVTGTTRLKLNQGEMRKIPIPLAPCQEQLRIVGKLDELFTQLDAGVASLKRIQTSLQRYKAAVLKAACEGKLVAQDPNDEPASQLLERILVERRARWEEELRAKGKDPRKAKYEEPAPPDTEGLAEMPEGWVWANLDQVMDLTAGVAFKESEYSSQGVRLLQIANVSFGKIIWDQQKYLPDDYLAKYPNLQLKAGDILMALNRPIIGDALKIGALNETDAPAILYQRVGRFDVYLAGLSAYLLYFAQSPLFVSRLKSKLQGVDQPFVTKPSLMNIPLPLPPMDEQYRIVAELERRLSVVEELEAIVEKSLKRAERLRQSILRQAFEGKLVRQDPSDEPVSVLLERLRSSTAPSKTLVKPRGRRIGDVGRQLRLDGM